MRKIGKKDGQIQLSFGFIFSVIIIMATLSAAIIVIWKFIVIDEKVECAKLKSDLQNQIDKIWASDGDVSYPFAHNVAPKTTQVCFGSLSQNLENEKDRKIYDELKKNADFKNNFYIYPKDSCGKGIYRYQLQHMNTSAFFCANIQKGKVNFKIVKGSFDSSVKIIENSDN